MMFPAPAGDVTVRLANGDFERLPICPRCGRPEIRVKEQQWLRENAVDLGRCTCGSAVGA